MKNASTESNVIWAIDPLVANAQKLMNSKKALQALQKKKPFRILPVSLLTSDDLHLPLSLMAPWGEKLQELAENVVRPFLKSLSLKNIAEPGIIMGTSKNHSIDDFLMYAKSQKAQMIVTTTHEKGGAEKNRIGKFTQKLIEKSTIPVLTVRPNTTVSQEISKILYPTDFSAASKKSYLKTIQFAKKLKAKIIIYHNIYEPVIPSAEFTGIAIQSSEILREYSKEFSKNLKARAEKWIKMASEEGVRAEFKGVRANFSLSKSILAAAQKERVHLIALGIESHPLMRAFLGSSTREVIANSPKPVLILNSKIKTVKKSH